MSKTKIIVLISNLILLPTIVVLLAGFIIGNFDFGSWSAAERLAMVFAGALLLIMSSIVIIDFKADEE